MYTRLCVVVWAGLGAAVALAQSDGIQWSRDVQGAIAASQRTQLPLMFWVLSSSRDRDNNLENDQRAAFRDPEVVRLSQRFITARVSRSANRDLLQELKLPRSTNMEIVFVTPDGTVLDRLSPSGVARPASLAQKMKLVFKAYRQQLFTRELKPTLEKAGAPPQEVRTALERIRDLHITTADKTLLKLLDRPGLDRQTTRLCYETLASLSTKPAVEKLLALSAEGKPLATEALKQCTPAGAELMLDQLVTEDGLVRLDVYDALVESCGIRKRKSHRWWERAKESLLVKEIKRVKGLVADVAEQWKAENEW